MALVKVFDVPSAKISLLKPIGNVLVLVEIQKVWTWTLKYASRTLNSKAIIQAFGTFQ